MKTRPLLVALLLTSGLPFCALGSGTPVTVTARDVGNAPASLILAGSSSLAGIAVDPADYPVVTLAANLFADDINRVTGRRPIVSGKPDGPEMIIAGTLGHSALIDQLIAAGRLPDADQLAGRWEATLSQLVEKPFPGVDRALVIVGSDRRGTAYGLMRLSQEIGVSPWYWWADVPVAHHDLLSLSNISPQFDTPGVKYRGIFINDEDWGINPWASNTFDPDFKNIGPKTYAKVFELMLRLRLNYIWPAMHGCSTEFGSVPENVALADKFGIVAGASHCEPMLCNNVKWDEKARGPWNYSTNRDVIHAYWENMAEARATDEAVWTLGIRGIHDRAMETPPSDIPGKMRVVSQAIADQRALIDQYVTHQWGPVAQCFVPYKEVLPVYDAGLNVPPDVTLVWADDNFGYIRRLSSPVERQRPGGSGVYWHVSYYGAPHSYTWIETTPPALMWEELRKAWDNGARTLWMLNVGDIKPAEMAIDYYSRLAWNPEAWGPDSQPVFLREFTAENFGPQVAPQITDMLMAYYRLGTIRKPELMNRAWALSLSPGRADELARDYTALLELDRSIAAALPPQASDAYTEMIGFPARILADSGLLFLADRKAQQGVDIAANETEVARLRDAMTAEVVNYNTRIAGGKWNRMMPGLETGKNLASWSSQVRWPWGEKPAPQGQPAPQPPPEPLWRDAASPDHATATRSARWTIVPGLGQTGRAVALLPAASEVSWTAGNAPTLEYNFSTQGTAAAVALIDFLPTFRIYPGMKLRVSVAVDDQPPAIVEVPGSSGAENESGPIRTNAVQDNFARATLPLPNLPPGRHTVKITALDPGAVIDRLSLP